MIHDRLRKVQCRLDDSTELFLGWAGGRCLFSLQHEMPQKKVYAGR